MDKNSAMPLNPKIKTGIELLDLKMALAVVICLLTSMYIPQIQYMPACFAAILCAQDSAMPALKNGLNRVAVTLIGGVIGVGVVLLDNIIQKTWCLMIFVMAGIILVLVICRLLKLPNMPARIGCVTFVLVIMVMNGEKRINYALFRLLGTVYGAIIALLVSWLLSLFVVFIRPVFQFRPFFRGKPQ
jgi:uncharacterized membrane protein YgaE (UPF0421/DUF939 family)